MGNAESSGDYAVEERSGKTGLCESFGLSCLGIFLFVLSFILLGWNEVNYVRNQKIIFHVEDIVVEAKCIPEGSYAGKLIHTSCPITLDYDFAIDARVQAGALPKFSSDLRGAWVETTSEIYQWVEQKKCKESNGHDLCQYTYTRDWVDKPVDSSRFYCIGGRLDGCRGEYGTSIENRGTIPRALDQRVLAPDFAVAIGVASSGGYKLNQGLVDVFAGAPLALAGGLTGTQATILPGMQVVDLGGGRAAFKASPAADSIGDVRTTFTKSAAMLGSTYLSIIALQSSGASVAGSGVQSVNVLPYNTGMKGTMSQVNWAVEGNVGSAPMLAVKANENAQLVIVIRVLGFVLMWVSVDLILGPIAAAPGMLPFIGDFLEDMVSSALCCVAGIFAAALSLVVIAIAWILARPLVGLLLLGVAGALVAGIYYMKEQKVSKSRDGENKPLLQDHA